MRVEINKSISVGYAMIPSWVLRTLCKFDLDALAVYAVLSTYLVQPGGIATVSLDQALFEAGVKANRLKTIADFLQQNGMIVHSQKGWYLPWTK